MKQIFHNNIWESIGNIPLVKLSKIVPVACDSGMKYLTGDLYS